MKRALVLLIAAVIVAFAASGAWAQAYSIMANNFLNADGSYPQIPYDYPGTYYSTLPNGPTATEDGMLWLNTGAGPVLHNASVGVTVWYEDYNSVWKPAISSVYSGGYSGYFVDAVNNGIGGNSDYLVLDSDPPLIVSNETIPNPNYFDEPFTFRQAKFYVQAWYDPELAATGTTSAYSSYAQAFTASEHGAPGVYVAQTPVFLGDLIPPGDPAGWWDNYLGMYMPAMVLTKAVPEPSTIALAVTGLLGLLAYGWRKST